MEVLMKIGEIKKYDSWLNNERLHLIALEHEKEKEIRKEPGVLFSTGLIAKRFSK